jgi:hypothetical protein
MNAPVAAHQSCNEHLTSLTRNPSSFPVVFSFLSPNKRRLKTMAEEQNQGGFPQNQSKGDDAYSTTGDGHPPRPGEKGTQEDVAGQGLGQGGSSEGSSGSGGSSQV